MTNGAAIGYAIIAMKELGYTDDQASTLARWMYETMDVTTEEEAEEVYRKS